MKRFSLYNRGKRAAAFCISAVMALSVFSGCKADTNETVPEETTVSSAEITQLTTSETVSETVSETEAPVAMDTNIKVLSISADKTLGDYIERDTSFTITTAEDIEVTDLAKGLSISPDVPFDLIKSSANTFSLKCSSSLPDSSVIKIKMSDEGGTEQRWAFQTEDIFRVSGTYPSDKSSYAPVTAGIEITFTTATVAEEVKKNFHISPVVDGVFEQHNKTVVFIPSKDLEQNTVYTVKLSKGMKSECGTALEHDYMFSFKTEEGIGTEYCYAANGVSETFISDDQPLIEIYASSEIKNGSFDITLYRYDSAESYFEAVKDYTENVSWYEVDYAFSEKGLSQVYKDSVKLMLPPEDSSWRAGYLMLPENLEKGYYLAKVSDESGKFSFTRLIQINDIAVYSGVLPNSAAFFVNDAQGGNPASGAKITLYANDSEYECKVGSDGVAMMELAEEKYGNGVLKIEYGRQTYIDVFAYSSAQEPDPAEEYFMYLYSDREAYLSTDTIRVWGVIRPKKGHEASMPSNLSIEIGNYTETIDSCPISLRSDGTFTAELPLVCSGEKWYYLYLCSGEKRMCSKSIEVKDYVKPSYVISCDVPDLIEMPDDNPFEASVEVTYFDGTPAAGLEFKVSSYNNEVLTETVVTDENGRATASVRDTVPDKTAISWTPDYEEVSFSLSSVENEYQTVYANIMAVKRDVLLESKINGRTVEIGTYLIDTDKIDPGSTYFSFDTEKLKGDAFDTEVTAELTRSYYEKVETGSYYDFIHKQTVKTYEYDYRTEIVKVYNVKTKNGRAVISDLPIDDKNSFYYINFTWQDSKGRMTFTSANVNKRYSEIIPEAYHYYTLAPEKYTFKENESIRFDLQDGMDAVESNKGKIFYAMHKTDYVMTGVSWGTSFKCKMTADCIPNVRFAGAYFDGKHILPIHEDWESICFDPSDRELSVEITADKEQYSPGNDSEITVKVTDINGKAVENAAVSLSVVDEAAFAVVPQDPQPLGTLYSEIYYPFVADYCSYIQHCFDNNGGAEMGGGGDENVVRKDFKDNAAFLSGTTDAQGTAVFSFALPDNITSWRATAHAVYSNDNSDIFAGVSKEPVISTQPFYIQPVASSLFLDGDDICFTARTVGGNDREKITVTVKGNGVDKAITVDERKYANFGKLHSGDYTVMFSSENGKGSDAVELSFTVTDTMLETAVVKTFDLTEESIDIAPLRWPVSITFFDESYMLSSQVLRKLINTPGSRTDHSAARTFAAMKLGYISSKDYLSSLAYLKNSSLFRLWSYSDEDAELTALLCAVDPELINSDLTANRFYSIIDNKNSTSKEISCAYLGLAALDEPVLADIRRIVSDPVGFDRCDLLRFSCALAIIGDESTALRIYSEQTADKMKTAQNSSGELFADMGSEEENCASLMAASALRLTEAEQIARNLCDTKQTEKSAAAELMFYINRYVPKTSGDAVVSFKQMGVERRATLEKFNSCSVSFNKEQFENADIKVISGNVCCTVYYEGRLTDREDEPTVNVTKSLYSLSGGWDPGALIRVTISVDGDTDHFTVDDVIPSCARFIMSGDDNYISHSGQRISGAVYSGNSLTYYIRLSTSGEYLCEGAVVTFTDGSWGVSDRSLVTVK